MCKKSKGEIKIQDWLDLHNIKYETQKWFKDCRDKKPLPFDFYLPDLNICIKFQGRQHYKEGFDLYLHRYKDESKATELFNLQLEHDRIKAEYCKKNNIQLVVIKYTELVKEKLNFLI